MEPELNWADPLAPSENISAHCGALTAPVECGAVGYIDQYYLLLCGMTSFVTERESSFMKAVEEGPFFVVFGAYKLQ